MYFRIRNTFQFFGLGVLAVAVNAKDEPVVARKLTGHAVEGIEFQNGVGYNLGQAYADANPGMPAEDLMATPFCSSAGAIGLELAGATLTMNGTMSFDGKCTDGSSPTRKLQSTAGNTTGHSPVDCWLFQFQVLQSLGIEMSVTVTGSYTHGCAPHDSDLQFGPPVPFFVQVNTATQAGTNIMDTNKNKLPHPQNAPLPEGHRHDDAVYAKLQASVDRNIGPFHQNVITNYTADIWARHIGVFGDPHFQTWSGLGFDFMGACDLVLVHAPNFEADMGLDVHVRTTIRYDYSYVESAVVKIGEETLEVNSYGDYFLNQVWSAELPSTISGFPVNYKQPSNNKVHIFEIDLGMGEKIVLQTFKDLVNVKLDETSLLRFGGSYGMLGKPGTGEMLARDGSTIVADADSFGFEWQVKEDEPMLFMTARTPQAPQKCMLPTQKAAAATRRLGESAAVKAAAEKACAGISDGARKTACIRDVLATGDVDIAGTF
jgi:hypothetical protein